MNSVPFQYAREEGRIPAILIHSLNYIQYLPCYRKAVIYS